MKEGDTKKMSVALLFTYSNPAIVVLVLGMYVMWMLSLTEWLGGFVGFVVSIIGSPGIFVYPVIHWMVEESWPEAYLWCYLALVICIGVRQTTQKMINQINWREEET